MTARLFRFGILTHTLTAAVFEPYVGWIVALNKFALETLSGIESGACRLKLFSMVRFPTATLNVSSPSILFPP